MTVVVTPSKVTIVEVSSIDKFVIKSFIETTVDRLGMDNTVEIEVNVTVVSIAVRVTVDCDPEGTSNSVFSVP